jgi:hypothetical protein
MPKEISRASANLLPPLGRWLSSQKYPSEVVRDYTQIVVKIVPASLPGPAEINTTRLLSAPADGYAVSFARLCRVARAPTVVHPVGVCGSSSQSPRRRSLPCSTAQETCVSTADAHSRAQRSRAIARLGGSSTLCSSQLSACACAGRHDHPAAA